MSKVKDRKLVSTYGQPVLDQGFFSIPNLILDYQNELKLTDKELLFYIKVSHFFKKKYIKDKDLNMGSSRSTLNRIKNSLIEKGYLKIHVLYDKNENGKIIGIGTKYDWSGLIETLNSLPMCQNEQAESFCTSRDQNEQAESKMTHIIGNKGKESIDKESIDIKKKPHKSNNGKFKKPTIDEIQAYCKERKNKIDAEHFYYFYESKDWMIGKNKMKDWKASIITWERKQKTNNKKETQYSGACF